MRRSRVRIPWAAPVFSLLSLAATTASLTRILQVKLIAFLRLQTTTRTPFGGLSQGCLLSVLTMLLKLLSKVSALMLLLASIVALGIAGAYDSLAQEKFKVGVSAPLTGDLAEYGAAVRQGIELASSEDEHSFKNLQFIFEDNQYEGSKAVSAFQKLTNIDAVRVIYNWGEPTLHSIAPIAERQRVPVVAMSLDPAPANGKKYVLRSINYSDQYASKLMQYLRSKGLKNIAIINSEDPFLNSMIAGLKRHLAQGETLEVFATVNPNDQDFKSQIARLKTRKFDVVGVYVVPQRKMEIRL